MKTIIVILSIVLSSSLEAQIYINNTSKNIKSTSEKNEVAKKQDTLSQVKKQSIVNVKSKVKPTSKSFSTNQPTTYIRKKTEAVYKTIYETVLHSPETSKEVSVKPEYKKVEEKIMVSPKIKKWVKGEVKEDCKSPNPEDCQVLTLIEIPASYKTVKKEIVINQAETKTVISPKTFKVVKKKILVTPERYVDVQL